MMKYDKIFLVDDEPLVNAIQSLMIRKHFPKVELTNYSTATEALKVITEIDHTKTRLLVFLDLNMPVLDASGFLKQLEEKELQAYPDIYIITYSQNPEELNFVKDHRLVKEVFAKPLDDNKIEQLKMRLNEA